MIRSSKRIKKEIEILESKYLFINEEIVYHNEEICLVIQPLENNKKYLIKIDKKTFPFKPPNIFLKRNHLKINYIYFLKQSFLFYEPKLNIKNNNCVCCYNLISNWTVSTNICKVIDESENFYLQLKNYREQYFGIKYLKEYINRNNLNILDTIIIITEYLKWI